MSVLALRFLILTATRTGEVRFATFSGIDGPIWTIPAERTKTGREYRVPLSSEAQKVTELARNHESLVFCTERGKPLSGTAMSAFMKREGHKARPHGFRATFRTWVEDTTDTPFEVKEAALGHKVDTAWSALTSARTG